MSDLLTEFDLIDPTRVDAVGTPANGIGFLMLKSVDPADALDTFVNGLCGTSGCSVCHDRYQALKGSAGFVEKARMKAKERHALSDSDFAFPKERKEPLNDESHVRDAMSRFSSVEGVSDAERKEAARRIMARAKHLGIEVADDDDVAQAAKQVAPDRSVPQGEAESQTHEVDEGPGPRRDGEAHDGGEPDPSCYDQPRPSQSDRSGDTAPDKAVPRGEALSQTHSLGKDAPPSDGTGDRLRDGEHETAGAEDEAQSQTEEVEKDAPASPEHNDVALGEKAEALVNELGEVIRTFTMREKAEGGTAAKEARRVLSRVQYLLETPALIQKGAEMGASATELLSALGEHESARRAEKIAKKAEKKAFDKAVKKEAKKLAKKGGDEPAEDAKASKAAEVSDPEDLAKSLQELSEQVAKIAAEDGKRIPLNGFAPVAYLRDNPDAAASVYKSFEDRIGDAEDRVAKAVAAKDEFATRRAREELRTAKGSLAKMKMVVAEHARTREPEMIARRLQGQGVPLLKVTDQLGEDRDLKSL